MLKSWPHRGGLLDGNIAGWKHLKWIQCCQAPGPGLDQPGPWPC